MKVGDYVRFKTLSREIKIGKVIEIIEPDKESMKKHCVYDLDNNEATVNDYVIKSSQNIIDLIEVGDYVNGHRVFDKAPGCVYVENIENKINHIPITRDNLNSVLSKEQFESMEYKIGD